MENSLNALIKFFEVKTPEFMEFWKSLSDAEKTYYKTADIS